MKDPSLFLERPVFVCGHRRSGTTMLVSLLDAHSQLVVYPGESGYFYAVYPRLFGPGTSRAARVRQIADFCVKNVESIVAGLPVAEQRALAFPFRAFRAEFRRLAATSDASAGPLIRALLFAFWKVYGAPERPLRWVEKTTSSEIYALDAAEWFPKATFIHVLRDPRDNWASLKSGWDVRFKYHNDRPERLMHSMIERGRFGFELAERNRALLGSSRYLVLRYEDLLRKPQQVMHRVASFIGIRFEPTLLQPTMFGRPWGGNNYSGQPFSGLSKANVGRWRQRITSEEAALLEFHFETAMRTFDYRLACTPTARVKAAVNHYKWYNYAQAFSFEATKKVSVPSRKDTP